MMPHAAPTVCCWAGCNAYSHGRYCEKHKQEYDQRRWKQANERRPGNTKAYGKKWRKLRGLVLHRNPLCKSCGAPAKEVDHIIPLKDGGTNQMSNLQALCKSCHSRKTGRENGWKG